ncbi:hypothetical protein IB286_05515 [Spongiibacter sp. KMU-158]|uniref:Lipoprotein n=1 Tax=Spongiibacter pelagi TaxID=2760804 RepID=A0A927BZI4_9GAMM|nr:hypothetical protein [Spongiibacter pelagi]MBD2858463.1 hypothetical protein [Spongiibacter pelagi]
MKRSARLSILFFMLLLTACSSTTYNPTVFKYYMSDSAKTQPIKRVLLASVNVTGEPTRSILRDSDDKVDGMVADYLRENGFEIASQHHFNNAWQQALLTYGEFYDPTTGRVNREGWQKVMTATLQALQSQKDWDVILFTDLIEDDVQHSGGMKHYARWYGVTREPATQGGSTSVSVEFNWSQIIKAGSLMVTMFDRQGQPIFSSRGGIDTLYGIDTRKSQKGFVRRSKILNKSSYIEEGIQLAFHPFIKMDRYPAPPAEKTAEKIGKEA